VAQCLKANIRVLSCMGAGGKSDVTRVHVSDLKTAARDPLATKLRQHLKKLMGDEKVVNSNKINFSNGNSKNSKKTSFNNGGDKMNHKKKKDKDDEYQEYLENMQQLTVVYSSEKTVVKLADFSDEQKDANDGTDDGTAFHEYGAVDNMRVRVLPVLGTMPAVMGQALAAVALTDLGGKPFQAVPMEKISRNVRNKVHQKLMRREELLTRTMFKMVNKFDPDEKGDEDSPGALLWKELNSKGGMVGGVWVGPLSIDIDDFDYLLDVWRNRCAVTGARLGTTLQLTRWDMQRPGTCDNLVLMSQHALLAYDKEGGKDKIPAHVQKTIEARLATCILDRFPVEE
jgi:tRNA A37 threonylcarbamoyladenosine dehydratase